MRLTQFSPIPKGRRKYLSISITVFRVNFGAYFTKNSHETTSCVTRSLASLKPLCVTNLFILRTFDRDFLAFDIAIKLCRTHRVAFQIYGDFSGYSDIAIGTARLFGFNLKQNFAMAGSSSKSFFLA